MNLLLLLCVAHAADLPAAANLAQMPAAERLAQLESVDGEARRTALMASQVLRALDAHEVTEAAVIQRYLEAAFSGDAAAQAQALDAAQAGGLVDASGQPVVAVVEPTSETDVDLVDPGLYPEEFEVDDTPHCVVWPQRVERGKPVEVRDGEASIGNLVYALVRPNGTITRAPMNWWLDPHKRGPMPNGLDDWKPVARSSPPAVRAGFGWNPLESHGGGDIDMKRAYPGAHYRGQCTATDIVLAIAAVEIQRLQMLPVLNNLSQIPNSGK